MYVWLNVTPEEHDKKTGKVTQHKPRIKQAQPKMPDISGGEDLFQHLLDFGGCIKGSDVRGLDWVNLHSWANSIGLEFTPWELETLHRLSQT